MPRRTTVALIGALAGVCVLLAGCSGSGVNAETLDPPATTATPAPLSAAASPSAAPSLSAASSAAETSMPRSSSDSGPTTGTSTSGGASAAETAARAAVESQWIKSWDVYLKLPSTPSSKRKDLASAVAVDPALSAMLKDAESITAQGLDTYGDVGHRIFWTKAVDGAAHALISDCQDASHSGSYEVASARKKTVGVERQLVQGNLVRGEDGVWKIAEVYYLKDEKC